LKWEPITEAGTVKKSPQFFKKRSIFPKKTNTKRNPNPTLLSKLLGAELIYSGGSLEILVLIEFLLAFSANFAFRSLFLLIFFPFNRL